MSGAHARHIIALGFNDPVVHTFGGGLRPAAGQLRHVRVQPGHRARASIRISRRRVALATRPSWGRPIKIDAPKLVGPKFSNELLNDASLHHPAWR